jgi:hypothetical protein
VRAVVSSCPSLSPKTRRRSRAAVPVSAPPPRARTLYVCAAPPVRAHSHAVPAPQRPTLAKRTANFTSASFVRFPFCRRPKQPPGHGAVRGLLGRGLLHLAGPRGPGRHPAAVSRSKAKKEGHRLENFARCGRSLSLGLPPLFARARAAEALCAYARRAPGHLTYMRTRKRTIWPRYFHLAHTLCFSPSSPPFTPSHPLSPFPPIPPQTGTSPSARASSSSTPSRAWRTPKGARGSAGSSP